MDSLRENQVFLVGDKITFLPNSIVLTPESKTEIEAIYTQVQFIEGKITVVGHAANIGDQSAQIELSARRAKAVMDFLLS